MAAGDKREGHDIAKVSIGTKQVKSGVTGLNSCWNRSPNGASKQAAALRQEGVAVSTGSLGELMVDFR